MRPATPPFRQRGAALLLAMIIVTLVTTLAAGMVWQQWRSVQTETAERGRTQSAWILSGALDWAGLILKEDDAKYDHASEPWGTPLAEARLSTFLSVDQNSGSNDDGPEAFLSGQMTDAQSRFNVRNLIDDEQQGAVSKPDLEAFGRLCDIVGVSSGVATVVASGMRNAYAAPNTAGISNDRPLRPRRVSDLKWLGVDDAALRRLEPYIVLLEQPTDVNVNTASREVIAAVVPGLNVGDAERLVQYRQRTPLKVKSDVSALLGLETERLKRLNVMTRHFEVRGRLRLDDRVLEQRSIVRRDQKRITVLYTELVNFQDVGR